MAIYYRNVSICMWDDERVLNLDLEAFKVWVYLLTGPGTTSCPGVIRSSNASLSEAFRKPSASQVDDLVMNIQAASRGLGEVLASGLALQDVAARLIWLPNGFKHARPQSVNVIKSWASVLDDVPKCQLKQQIVNNLWKAKGSLPVGLADAFAEAFASQPYSEIEIEIDQEIETETEIETEIEDPESAGAGASASAQARASPLSPPEGDSPPTVSGDHALVPKNGKPAKVYAADVKTVIAHYVGYHPKAKPGDDEKKKIRARLKDGYSAADLCRAIDGIHKSAFHQGENQGNKRYDTLELVVRKSSQVAKFIEIAEKPQTALTERSQRNFRATERFMDRHSEGGKDEN